MKVILKNSSLAFEKAKDPEVLGTIVAWNTLTTKVNFYMAQSKFTDIGATEGKKTILTLSTSSATALEKMTGQTVKLGFYTSGSSAVAEKSITFGESWEVVLPALSTWANFYVNADVENVGTAQFNLEVKQ